jgi:hypothetical protein
MQLENVSVGGFDKRFDIYGCDVSQVIFHKFTNLIRAQHTAWQLSGVVSSVTFWRYYKLGN